MHYFTTEVLANYNLSKWRVLNSRLSGIQRNSDTYLWTAKECDSYSANNKMRTKLFTVLLIPIRNFGCPLAGQTDAYRVAGGRNKPLWNKCLYQRCISLEGKWHMRLLVILNSTIQTCHGMTLAPWFVWEGRDTSCLEEVLFSREEVPEASSHMSLLSKQSGWWHGPGLGQMVQLALQMLLPLRYHAGLAWLCYDMAYWSFDGWDWFISLFIFKSFLASTQLFYWLGL